MRSYLIGVIVLCLDGCSKRDATPPQDIRLIEYSNSRRGFVYDGTVSNDHGALKFTWIYKQNGQPTVKEVQITPERFQQLWDGVTSLPVFKRAVVLESHTKTDLSHYHVITSMYTVGHQHGFRTVLLPDTESDPEFVRWLSALDVPP